MSGRTAPVGDGPDYRASLANERTYLAWIRTSLAMLAGGVAVVELVPPFAFTGARELLGGVMASLSLTLAASAHRRWSAVERAMRQGDVLPHSRLLPLVGVVLSTTAAVVLAFILVG
ncbi:MAG: DUF202 domain-containing protein [Nocardioidaceae bacterium]|nr:DUF202 domain-containing protein [Nocardioidaceae bacterium]